MGAILSIIIQSSIVMLAMYLIYKWALASENFHAYNRAILLSIYAMAPIVALGSGFLSFHNAHRAIRLTDVTTSDLLDLFLLNNNVMPIHDAQPVWPKALIIVWITGMAFFAIQTIYGSVRLRRLVRKGEEIAIGNYRLIIIDDAEIAPFSTRRLIVMNRNDYNSAADMILAHETGHLDKCHWLDLLLARTAIIIGWFNPATWLIAEELKSVHEYQADMAVLKSGADSRQYQMLLIKKAVGKSFPAIANSLNHSKLKKRITMMLKSKQRKSRKLRALALVPAAAVALLVTNLPAVATCLATVGQSQLSAMNTDRKGSEKVNNNPTVEKKSVTVSTKGKVENVTKATETPAKAEEINVVHISGDDSSETDNGSKTAAAFKITVDGQPYSGDINTIDPESIKSMNVIKGDQTTINIVLKKPGDKDVRDVSQVMPQFPGGEKAMLEWLAQNVEYPDVKLDEQPEKVRVIVKFVVDKNGKAIDPEIVSGGPDVYNQEAIKVINKMPVWEPGQVDGQPVNVTYTLPINFKTKRDNPETK